MATPNFIPELWSQQLMEVMKKQIDMAVRLKRTKGAQLLRDAALGYPEYPEPPKDEYRQRRLLQEQMTATEINMRQEHARRIYDKAGKQMADSIDAHIFDSFRYGTK